VTETKKTGVLINCRTSSQLHCGVYCSAVQLGGGGYNYDSTSIRRAFDCLSKVIKFTVTWSTRRRSHAQLYAVHTIRLLDKLSVRQLHSVNTTCDSWTDSLSN